MIIRTYQRRNRAGGLNDSSQESFWSSSQESVWSSSQETALSSQELGGWSLSLEEDNLSNSLQRMGSLEPSTKRRKKEGALPRAPSTGSLRDGKKTGGKVSKELQRKVGLSLNKRWGCSAPANSTLLEAQESGEITEQVDEVNFAIDGLREAQPLQIQQASLVSILSLCVSVQQRRFLRLHGIAKSLLEAVVALPTTNSPLSLAAAAVLYLFACDAHDSSLMDTEPCIKFLLKLIGTSNDGDNEGASTVEKVAAVFDKLRSGKAGGDVISPDQLTPESLALRTLERACLSAVSLDDNSGTVTKVSGQFKERLRKLGGLDVICDVAANCLSRVMSKCSRSIDSDIAMLLRCLRVMENVTFLSEDNQRYLLDFKHNNPKLLPRTFIEIVIKTIDTLQEIINKENWCEPLVDQNLDATSLKSSGTGNSCGGSKTFCPESKPPISTGIRKTSNRKEMKLRNALENAKILNSQRKVSLATNCQKMVEVKVSGKEKQFKDLNQTHRKASSLDGEENGFLFSQDPYEFNEMDTDCRVSVGKGTKRTLKSKKSSAPAVTIESDEKVTLNPNVALIEECLLSSVKVLMNLTNDNAPGCKQVAACNGIHSVASLLVSNYPRESQTEASLDLLVTTLGMLVNLVEKDGNNRRQLVNLDVNLPSDIGTAENGGGMISLLCSLFLSKKGSGEAAEAREMELEEEESLKRGQSEAENMILEAYTALVLAFLSTESEASRQAIAGRLPAAEGLQALVPVLDRFVAFHLSLNMISTETHAVVTEVINSLKGPAVVQEDVIF